MNGFIQRSSRKMLLLAAMGGAATGCRTTETCGTSCGGNACGQSAEGCASCAGGNCLFGNVAADCKDFDPEQLHGDHCWPEQYDRLSRQRVRDPLGQQMNNGIAVESTLWSHYFQNERGKEHELNEAGMSRLQYLARRKPYVVPNLNLQTSWDRDLDQKRIQTAIDYLAKYSLEPQPWQVAVVNSKPTGLFGVEGPKSISKMVGPQMQPPLYEPQTKQSFLSSGNSGGGGGSGS